MQHPGYTIIRPHSYLLILIGKAESLISRKIRYMIVKPEEKEKYLAVYPEALLLWERNTGSSNNNK